MNGRGITVHMGCVVGLTGVLPMSAGAVAVVAGLPQQGLVVFGASFAWFWILMVYAAATGREEWRLRTPGQVHRTIEKVQGPDEYGRARCTCGATFKALDGRFLLYDFEQWEKTHEVGAVNE